MLHLPLADVLHLPWPAVLRLHGEAQAVWRETWGVLGGLLGGGDE